MPSNLQSLREQLRERFPEAHQSKLPPPSVQPSPRLPAFPAGALSELTPITPASGLSLILAELLKLPSSPSQDTPSHHLRSGPGGEPLALIDGKDSFDPASYGALSCARLLWIRCQSAEESLCCADLLLHDGNLPLLVLDLQLNPLEELRAIPPSSWYRLRNLTQQSGTALLVFTPSHLVPCASLQLTLDSSFSLADLGQDRESLSASYATKELSSMRKFS